MEFIHGAFRTNNPNAFFFIRQSENLLKNLPEKYNDRFRDKDERSQKQIQELKNQLGDMIPPEQIYSYSCFYDGLDSSTGRERVEKRFEIISFFLTRLFLGENRWSRRF